MQAVEAIAARAGKIEGFRKLAGALRKTGAEMQRAQERMDKVVGEIAKAVTLVVDLAEITPDQVREIDAEDFIAVTEQLGDFLRDARPASVP